MESESLTREVTSIFEVRERLQQAERSKSRPDFSRELEKVRSLPYDETVIEPWTQRALCLEFDPELFFRRADEGRAKQVCDVCDVAKECLIYALRTNQPEGVWGGLTTAKRKKLKQTMVRRRSIS